MKTAILVDGGFYRKRAASLWGIKTAEARAKELQAYCQAHLKNQDSELYRVFYYDCAPSEGQAYHPLKQKNVNLKKTDTYAWTQTFLDELKKARKFAVRLGFLSDIATRYTLKPDVTKKLFAGTLKIDDITENDFAISIEQKGVDMKLGIDISSLAYKKQVDQIILISGDSDFVPAAKLARREGIDFILDPMWATIKPNLSEHIDGIHSCWPKKKKTSPLTPPEQAKN
jgi:uncharacterized LabA/DUF88 family protein